MAKAKLWRGPIVLSHMDALRICAVYERNLALTDTMTQDEILSFARLKIECDRRIRADRGGIE